MTTISLSCSVALPRQPSESVFSLEQISHEVMRVKIRSRLPSESGIKFDKLISG